MSRATGYNSVDTMSYLWSALFALLIVIVVIVLTLKLVKFMNNQTLYSGKTNNIKLIDSLSISQTTKVHVVEVANKPFVIVENQGAIEIISDIEKSELIIQKDEIKDFKAYFSAGLKKAKESFGNKDDEE